MDSLQKRKVLFVALTAAAIGFGLLAIFIGHKTNYLKDSGNPTRTSAASSRAVSSSLLSSENPSTTASSEGQNGTSSAKSKYTDIDSAESSIFNGASDTYSAVLDKDGFTYPEKATGSAFTTNTSIGDQAAGLNKAANIKVDAENVKGLCGTITATGIVTGDAAKKIMNDYNALGLYHFKEAPATLQYAVITCKLQMNLKPGTGVNYTYDLTPFVCQSNVDKKLWKANYLNGVKVNYNTAAISDAQFTTTGDPTIYKVLCLVPAGEPYNICFNYDGDSNPCAVLNPGK